MYTKQEQEVMNLLQQVKTAYRKACGPDEREKKRRSQSVRRDDSYHPDEEAAAFFRGLHELEMNIKARAADRLNDMDLSDYVKAFIKDQHPNAEDITFKVDFTNKEIIKSKMNVTPSPYGGVSTTVEKRVLHEGDEVTMGPLPDLDEDDEDC